MKILRMFVLLLVFAWLTPGLPAFAQNEPWTLKGAAKANSRPEPQERQDSSYYQRKGYKLDDRYQHNRYYPPQGSSLQDPAARAQGSFTTMIAIISFTAGPGTCFQGWVFRSSHRQSA